MPSICTPLSPAAREVALSGLEISGPFAVVYHHPTLAAFPGCTFHLLEQEAAERADYLSARGFVVRGAGDLRVSSFTRWPSHEDGYALQECPL